MHLEKNSICECAEYLRISSTNWVSTSCLIRVHSTFKGQVHRSVPKTEPRPWPSAPETLVGWARFPGFPAKRVWGGNWAYN